MPPKYPADPNRGASTSKKFLEPPAGVASASSSQAPGSDAGGDKKKRRHRAGKKRKNRRQSFAAGIDENDPNTEEPERPSLQDVAETSTSQSAFYRLGNVAGRSNETLDSEILLDHR